jgi:hypothetical protein
MVWIFFFGFQIGVTFIGFGTFDGDTSVERFSSFLLIVVVVVVVVVVDVLI